MNEIDKVREMIKNNNTANTKAIKYCRRQNVLYMYMVDTCTIYEIDSSVHIVTQLKDKQIWVQLIKRD